MSATLELYTEVRRRYPPSRQILPPAVNSALTCWWLALIFTLVGFAAFWPMLVKGLAGMVGLDFLIDKKTQELTTDAWYALAGFAGAMILFGLFFTIGVIKKSKLVLNTFRLSFVIGLLFGLAVGGGMVYVLMGDAPKPAAPRPGAGGQPAVTASPVAPPLGPAPYLGGALLAITGLVPIFFGILGLSLAGSKSIREYFENTDQKHFADLLPPPEGETSEAVDSERTAEEEELVEEGVDHDFPETAAASAETMARDVRPLAEARREAGLADSAREAATALDAVLSEEGVDLTEPASRSAREAASALDAVYTEEDVDLSEPASRSGKEASAALDAVMEEEGVSWAEEAVAEAAEAEAVEAVEAEEAAEAVAAEMVDEREKDDPKRTMLAPKEMVDDAEEAIIAEEDKEADEAPKPPKRRDKR